MGWEPSVDLEDAKRTINYFGKPLADGWLWPRFVLKKHLKSGLIVMMGQVTVAVISLLTVRILTECLSPANYGLLVLGITFSLIANQVIFGPLGAGITRFFAAAVEQKETSEYIQAALTLTKYAMVVLVGFACISEFVLFLRGSTQWMIMLGGGVAFSLVSGVYALANGVFLAKNAQVTLTFFQNAEPLVRLIFAVILIVVLGATAKAALLGYVLGGLIVVLLQSVKLHKTDPVHCDVDLVAKEKWQKKILNYGLPYTSWGVFTTVHLSSDRWVLNWTQGEEQVGFYASIYQIGYLPVTMLVNVVVQLITPYFFATAGSGTNQEKLRGLHSSTRKAVRACIVVTLILTTIGYFLHGWVYKLFVSEVYASVSRYLPIMIFAGGMFSSGQVATLAFLSSTKTKALIPIKIGSAVIGILLNAVLGTAYGIPGMAIASALTSVLYLIWVISYGVPK